MLAFDVVLDKLGLDKSATTVKKYGQIYSLYDRFLNGQEPTIENAEEFVASRPLKSKNSISNYRTALRTYFNYNDIEIPKRRLKTLRSPPARTDKFVTLEEVQHFCEVIDNLRDKCIIRFLFHVGVRASELITVDVGDLNFEEREVKIKGVKFSHRTRPVYIIRSELLLPILANYLQSRGIDVDNLKPTDKKKPLFSQLYSEERLTYEAIKSLFKRLRKKVKHDEVSAHWFRHGFVVWNKQNGTPPEITAQQIGDTVGVTVKIYSHYGYDDVKRHYLEKESKIEKQIYKKNDPLEQLNVLGEQNRTLEDRLKEIEAQNSLIMRALKKIGVSE